MPKLKVAVLMGGVSAERAVSLSTGTQVLNALDPDKYTVYALDTVTGQTMLPQSHAPLLGQGGAEVTALTQLPLADINARPDVVFIALHGPGGEDGTVQGMLEVLGLPYTGSGVLASALAMDKGMCKHVLISGGVPMARDVLLHRGETDPLRRVEHLRLPWVVKPNAQGSTIGMTILQDASGLEIALDNAFAYDSRVLVEEFIAGMEITVPVLGNDALEVLPIVEIVPASGFYDYEAKYTPGATDEICPARLPETVAERARDLGRICHRLLGCRGMSRMDAIVTPAGEIVVLEVNTIPGMTPTSLLPRSAGVAGYTFSTLLDKLIGFALEAKR